MYESWFLDYASYVILDRTVPHLNDGLKPVQRRILHAMKKMEDGRFNKVANIVGSTMPFHPHGDSSIYGALVQLGQKNLLIDCQGNWGNIFTGDSAAAGRYIEARLSKFALDVAFNSKITGGKCRMTDVTRSQLPSCEISAAAGPRRRGHSRDTLLHHSAQQFQRNNRGGHCPSEGQPFQLLPDFPTGGMLDVSKYNDGERGGRVTIRSHITKLDNKTLVVNDIPTETTKTVIDSIIKANEKGKINIKKVDDDTAAKVEIVIQLEPKHRRTRR